MSSHKISELIIIFQVYGVVTLRSKFSYFATFVSLLITVATIWRAYTEGPSTLFKTMTVSGLTRSFSHLLLFSSRVSVLMSSVRNMGKFHCILDEFESFDRTMERKFEIGVNTKQKFLWLGSKLILILSAAFIIPMINLAFPRVNGPFWIIAVTSAHMLHVKEVSLIFFVDSLNYRLELLAQASCKETLLEVLTLHSKLWETSKLINESHGIVTLTLAQNCFGVLVNIFYFFLIVCNLGFVVPVSRKFQSQTYNLLFDTFLSFCFLRSRHFANCSWTRDLYALSFLRANNSA